MPTPTLRHYAALLTSILLNSSALMLLKVAALRGLSEPIGPDAEALLRVGADPVFLLAVATFLGGIYFWIVALRRIDLSLAYPSVSLSYGLIAVVSRVFFAEHIGGLRWLGIAFIILGVALMHLPRRA